MSKGPHVADEQIAQILLTMGDEVISLKAACEQHKLSYANVRRRIALSEELKTLYACAREDYQRAKVAEMHEIAITEPDVQRARLRTDLIKWEASKVLPKEFGEKIEIDASVKGSINVVIGGDA